MSEETKVRIDVQLIAYIAKCQGVKKTINELLDFNKDLRKYCPAHKRFKERNEGAAWCGIKKIQA